MTKLKRVLLVDDDPVSIFLLKGMLEKLQVTESIHTAKNGEQALKLIAELINAQEHCPELIFLDINMPVMNGFEFMELFNHLDLKDSVNIVVLTSSQDERDIKRMNDLGIKKIIPKPLNKTEVMEIVDDQY
jgi:CheY-like chemotaxis protein